jgi:hypothetical protein
MSKRITIRFTPAEMERLEEIIRRARIRNPYASRSEILKELIGFRDTGIIHEEDRVYLRTSYEQEQRANLRLVN